MLRDLFNPQQVPRKGSQLDRVVKPPISRHERYIPPNGQGKIGAVVHGSSCLPSKLKGICKEWFGSPKGDWSHSQCLDRLPRNGNFEVPFQDVLPEGIARFEEQQVR